MTNEERNLLKKMASGALDGFVGGYSIVIRNIHKLGN